MTELLRRAAFETALQKDPYDHTTRLVYADWLEEFGTQPSDDDLATEHRKWTPEWQKAKEWLADFAQKISQPEYDWATDTEIATNPVTLEELTEAVQKYLDTGERIQLRGDGFGAVNLIYHCLTEFWENWETYTRTVLGRYDDPFRCCGGG